MKLLSPAVYNLPRIFPTAMPLPIIPGAYMQPLTLAINNGLTGH